MARLYAAYVFADSAEIRIRIFKILDVQLPAHPSFLHLPPKIPAAARTGHPLAGGRIPKDNNKIPADDESGFLLHLHSLSGTIVLPPAYKLPATSRGI